MGLDGEQLRRVSGALVAQLQQHTARQQTVSLQVQLIWSYYVLTMPCLPNLPCIHRLTVEACTISNSHVHTQAVFAATLLCSL